MGTGKTGSGGKSGGGPRGSAKATGDSEVEEVGATRGRVDDGDIVAARGYAGEGEAGAAYGCAGEGEAGAARGCAGEGAGATGGLAGSASSAAEPARSSSMSVAAARGCASVEGPVPTERNLCAGPMGADTVNNVQKIKVCRGWSGGTLSIGEC